MWSNEQELENYQRQKSQTISEDYNSKFVNEVEKSDLEFMRQKSSTVGGQTPVLLVCVYNKNGTLITHNVYYNLFSKYGKVLRILIFMKAKVWKAFVEMNSVENANLAKENLNDHVIFQDGSKINVFFSSLDTIKFQNDNSGGVDYTLIQQQCLVKQPRKPLNPGSSSFDQVDGSSVLSNNTNKEIKESTDRYDSSIQYLDQILQEAEQLERLKNYVHPQFLQENKESPVLYCRGLDNHHITGDYLMTLFMNFGNVVEIVKIPSKNAALVEFQNEVFSGQAKDYLNNQNFMGCQLKIFYSNYSTIKSRKQKTPEEECLAGNPKNFRYQVSNAQQSINPPSSILHVSNIKPEVCEDNSLIEFLAQVAPVVQYKIIEKDNKPMCLVQFQDISSAFLVMVTKQAQFLKGKKIHLSFTRSKI